MPGSKLLIQIGSMNAAIKDFRTEADEAVCIRDSKQLAVHQWEKRVHQAVNDVDIRTAMALGDMSSASTS